MARRVPRRLVIRQPVLVMMLGEHLQGLHAAGPLVLQMHILHRPVRPQLQSHDQFIPHGQRPGHGFEHRTLGGAALHEQTFHHRQWRAGVRGHLAHVLPILPIHRAPGHARVLLRHRHCALRCFHLRPGPALLVEPRPRLGPHGLHGHAAQGHLHQCVRGQLTPPLEQERVHGIRRALGRRPVARLLLLEQPHLAFLHRRGVARHFRERFNHQCLGLDRRAIPPPALALVRPIPSQLRTVQRTLLQ